MATAFYDPEGWEFPAGEICKLRFQDKKAELTAASDEAAETVSDFDKLQSSESDERCMEIVRIYLEDSNSPANKDPDDSSLLRLAKLLYVLKNSCDYDQIIKLVSPEKAISHSDMVISVFNILQLIHLYKLETAPGPNVAHVAAPAQNELEINDKQLRKNIRRATEEVIHVKSSEDGEYAERLEKVLNEYTTRTTYLASMNDKANVGQLFWTARKLYVLRQLYDNDQLEIRLKGFNASPKVQEIIERMDLLVEKNASMPDAGSSPNSVSEAGGEAAPKLVNFEDVNADNPDFKVWLERRSDQPAFKEGRFTKPELMELYREAHIMLNNGTVPCVLPKNRQVSFEQWVLKEYADLAMLVATPEAQRSEQLTSKHIKDAARDFYMLPFLFEHEELHRLLKSIPLDEVVDSVSSVLGELHKENHDINEAKRAGKMHQAQTKMIYELTRPIYARMNELRQQEIESNIDHGRMQMLYSEYEACCARTDFFQSIATLWVLCDIWPIREVQTNFPKLKALDDNKKESEAIMELLVSLNMHDAAVVEEGTPLQPPMPGSKMMVQVKKDNQEDDYDLVQIEDGKSEASQLYKGPATRWCRIERVEILEGDRQVPILPAPTLLGNNANANIEFKIHGDPVATSVKLLVWAQEACDPSAADEATPGFRKVHTSSLQFWPAGCHGNPKSGLENFKFDVLGVQRSTPNAQIESSDEDFKPSASTGMTQSGVTARPDRVLEELNFNDPSQHETEDREHPEIIITFDTHGGIGHQLDIGHGKFGLPRANLTLESQAVLAACRVLEIEGKPFKARVTLRIPHGLDDKKDMQTVDALKKLRDQKHPFPWSAYCGKTKIPLTQYGMFASRKHIVNAYGGIVKVDAQRSFNSIQEWQIMQTNAAHLDYQLEKQKIQKVNQGSHQISFYKVAGEIVLAGVQLQENDSSDQYRIAPGSPVILSWTQPADRQKGMLRCNGTVMENVFGIPGRQMIVALDPVRPREMTFLSRSTSINDLDQPRYAVRVTIKINTASIKHRVDAINKISRPEMERFHAAIIAQKTSSHEPIDPVKEASSHRRSGRKAYEDVLNSPHFAWNEDQKNCFYMARALPGGIAINEGVPGSGKSRLICGLTKMFSALKNRRGVPSVCTLIEVPTNAAGDAIYSAFTYFSTLCGAKASCIRVYTQTNENRAFLKKGKTSTSSAAEEAANDIVSATLIQVIATLRKNHESSRYGLEEHSLEARIIHLAEIAANNEGHACARFVQSGVLRNISDSLADPLPYLDKLPTDPDELFQVDLYPMILSYIKRMQAACINEWEDKSHIRLAKVVFGWVMEEVLAYAQVVIVTPYCCGGDTLAKSFGEKFDHIMIIEDETMRQTEIDTLLPLGKLRHREKILGLILCGDTKQPRPFAISTTGGDERVNEFGHQLTYPLGRRLIDAYHPQTAQWEQNRMLPILAEFPNEYTYVRMTNSPVACAQVVNANWDSMMTRILGRRQEPNNYVVLSIHGSEGFATPGHTSRQNPVHAEYIVYLVLQNYKANGYKPSEILVIAYYTEQVRLIGELFLKVVGKGLIALDQIPAVMTTAKSQGHQAQWVLGDVVVHNAEVKRDLGFVGTQEPLFNVFLTRAKTAFTGLAHRDIGSGQVAHEDKSKCEIIAFVQNADKRDAIVDITERPQEVAFLGVQAPAEIEATVATPDQADNNSWDQEQGQNGKEQLAVQEDIVGGDGADWGTGGAAEGGADWGIGGTAEGGADQGIGDAAEDGTDRNEGTGGEWSTAAY